MKMLSVLYSVARKYVVLSFLDNGWLSTKVNEYTDKSIQSPGLVSNQRFVQYSALEKQTDLNAIHTETKT